MDALTIGLIVILVLAVLVFLASGLKLIGDYEVGILYKKMFGKKMPQGQVVARNGEVGVQADILMPGLYWRIPIIWRVEKKPVTEILPSEVGIVESIDGVSIPKGTAGTTGEAGGLSFGLRWLLDAGAKVLTRPRRIGASAAAGIRTRVWSLGSSSHNH